MKRMLLLLSLSCLVTAGFAQVQRATPKKDSFLAAVAPVEDGMKRKEKLRALNLDKSQKQKIKALSQKNKTARQAIEDDDNLSASQKEEKIKGLKKEQAKEMQGLFTNEQKKKMREMRKAKKD
jgi:hypothetical protein